jgi:tryptophan halogenase
MQPGKLRIVVVGGGTAGWMCAATLANTLGSTCTVDLIESDEIGTVGVGEATIPSIRLFNNLMGLDEREFLRATNGTYKLGIQFVDWVRPGHHYFHAFGEIGTATGLVPFYHYWLRARSLGWAGEYWDHSVAKRAADANRFSGRAEARRGVPYAYHFDARLFALHLRTRAEKLGVRRIEGRVGQVRQDAESGFVRSVEVQGRGDIEGDLFIDCTGFHALLIDKTLQVPYEDWSRFLPCDRAAAVISGSEGPLTPYTRSTARAAGWQWRIPLQNRIGNGYVFCSGALNEDEAIETLLGSLEGEPLADPRIIRFTTGRRKKLWVKNVVAVGLASGFVEPLESTSIHLVQSALQRLISLFPDVHCDAVLADQYNERAAAEFEEVRDFLFLHYKLNERDDGAFWSDRAAAPVPDRLAELMWLFRSTGYLPIRSYEVFFRASWVQIALGQGLDPKGFHPIAEQISRAQLEALLDDSYENAGKEAALMPLAEDFIRQRGAMAPTPSD